MIQPALEALRTKADDIALLGRWRSGAILSATLAEAVVLFGVVIHLLGGERRSGGRFLDRGDPHHADLVAAGALTGTQ